MTRAQVDHQHPLIVRHVKMQETTRAHQRAGDYPADAWATLARDLAAAAEDHAGPMRGMLLARARDAAERALFPGAAVEAPSVRSARLDREIERAISSGDSAGHRDTDMSPEHPAAAGLPPPLVSAPVADVASPMVSSPTPGRATGTSGRRAGERIRKRGEEIPAFGWDPYGDH